MCSIVVIETPKLSIIQDITIITAQKISKKLTAPPKKQEKTTKEPNLLPFSIQVGVRGLELPTSTSRTWRANQLCYTPNSLFSGCKGNKILLIIAFL